MQLSLREIFCWVKCKATFREKSSSFVLRVSTTVLFLPQVLPTQLVSYANELLHRVQERIMTFLGDRDRSGETICNPLTPQFKSKSRQEPSISRPLYRKLTFTYTTITATHVQDHRINNDPQTEQTGCGSQWITSRMQNACYSVCHPS